MLFRSIRNFFPERWPAGDPELAASQGVFSDIDAGPTKTFLLANRGQYARQFELATGKRPGEELFDVEADPHCLVNLAGEAGHAGKLKELGGKLAGWMKETADPRAVEPRDGKWDAAEYFGGR